MPLEKANTLSELDMLYPLPSDPSSRGDDHLRLIKTVLKKQFPGKDGNGLNIPITLTEEFLNGLPKAIQDLQTNMDKRWPVGCLLFLVSGDDPQKGGFPGVWTKLAEDAALHINSGNQAAGTVIGENSMPVPLLQHSHGASFTGNQLPAHTHRTAYTIYGGTHWSGGGEGRFEWGGDNVSSVSAGTPSGSVSIQNAGTANPTLDVRGKRYLINVWRRVS